MFQVAAVIRTAYETWNCCRVIITPAIVCVHASLLSSCMLLMTDAHWTMCVMTSGFSSFPCDGLKVMEEKANEALGVE
jgi:hypothetical protein